VGEVGADEAGGIHRKGMEAMSHPKDWKPVHFANVGTDEVFIREMLEVVELLKGTMIEGQQREEATGAMGTIMTDGLIPTFMELQSIRESQTKTLPVVGKLQLYEDFARKLWKSYKDLTQRAAKAMGFETGFLYQEDKAFEEGLGKFRADWPTLQPGFEKFVRDNRKEWQMELRAFRNEFLEHQQGNRMDFQKFYDASFVEKLFDTVCGTIVDLLVILMSLKLPPRVHIVVNDEKIHGPWPNHFRWIIEGL
jgi:hypothetical protein